MTYIASTICIAPTCSACAAAGACRFRTRRRSFTLVNGGRHVTTAHTAHGLRARRHLSLEDAQAGVLSELAHYARAAWTFLNALGHINFGVAPAIAKRALTAPAERGSVIVVGAGLAGWAYI